MPSKKYRVDLSGEERAELSEVLRKGRCAAHKRRHAEVLLKADEGVAGPAWTDPQIQQAFGVSVRTVERIRRRLVEQGLATALDRAKQPRYRASRLDGEQQAHLVALACQRPPEGRSRWTLRLLAQQMVVRDDVDELSHETVRRVLKKGNGLKMLFYVNCLD